MQIKYVKRLNTPGPVMANTYNLRIEEAEAGGFRIGGQPVSST